MHKVTIRTCADYLVAAYSVVACALQDELSAKLGGDLRVRVDYKQAPSTFPELKRTVAEFGVLWVSDEHSEHSVYGVAGNVAFRTMHDLGHLSTGLTFSTEDEIALALHQWEQVRLLIPSDWRERCQAVYQADTIMQTLYYARHGQFPGNQSEFIQAALVAYK